MNIVWDSLCQCAILRNQAEKESQEKGVNRSELVRPKLGLKLKVFTSNPFEREENV